MMTADKTVKKVTRITLHYVDYDEETSEVKNEDSVTYDIYDDASKLDVEPHLTSVYFGDNSIDNILADYYVNSGMNNTVGPRNFMLGTEVELNVTGTPEIFTIKEDTPITPQLIRAYWQAKKREIPFLTKCSGSRAGCRPRFLKGTDF